MKKIISNGQGVLNIIKFKFKIMEGSQPEADRNSSPRIRDRSRSNDREQKSDEDNPKIYIAKIPIDIEKRDIEDLFDKFGRIADIQIKKRFAFIVK